MHNTCNQKNTFSTSLQNNCERMVRDSDQNIFRLAWLLAAVAAVIAVPYCTTSGLAPNPHACPCSAIAYTRPGIFPKAFGAVSKDTGAGTAGPDKDSQVR